MSGAERTREEKRRCLAEFLERHPDVQVIETMLPDLNGRLRGKWLERDRIEKVIDGGLKLPITTLALDAFGHDPAGWTFSTGDADGICVPAIETLTNVPWLARPTGQVLMSLSYKNGDTPEFDARNVLNRIVADLDRYGLRAVVACEMEFHLFQAETDADGTPRHTQTGHAGDTAVGGRTYELEAMSDAATFMHGVRDACQTQSLPVDALIKEAGPSQFEINLHHEPDALAAADHGVMLRRLIKGVAAQQGYRASFMAKPFAADPGNGMHIHVSLVDAEGNNIFDDGTDLGSDRLRQAVSGCLATMAELMLVFAPNANSYRRFTTQSHAPTAPSWGYDNRTVAVRVPGGDHHAMRIEHRVAGADANIHLVVAAILAGMLYGISEELDVPEPIVGDAYAKMGQILPARWSEAIAIFASSAFVRETMGESFQSVYFELKQQELASFDRYVSPLEYDIYL